jgi:hypothetical protein
MAGRGLGLWKQGLAALAASHFGSVVVAAPATALAPAAEQGCTCTGLDYTNGGSYLVDGSLEADFTFTSVFRCMFFSLAHAPLLADDLVGGDGYSS